MTTFEVKRLKALTSSVWKLWTGQSKRSGAAKDSALLKRSVT